MSTKGNQADQEVCCSSAERWKADEEIPPPSRVGVRSRDVPRLEIGMCDGPHTVVSMECFGNLGPGTSNCLW